MFQVMLDWETMGNKPNAAVIALGAVLFDTVTGEIGPKFYHEINLESSVELGLDLDASTVLWWMKQSDKARAKFATNERALLVREVMQKFTAFLVMQVGSEHTEYEGQVEVWGNGATFDNVIAANVYDKLGMTRPWKFYEDRCYRTVKSMHRDVPFVFEGTPHYALDDAISQAKHLCAIAKEHGILGATQ